MCSGVLLTSYRALLCDTPTSDFVPAGAADTEETPRMTTPAGLSFAQSCLFEGVLSMLLLLCCDARRSPFGSYRGVAE